MGFGRLKNTIINVLTPKKVKNYFRQQTINQYENSLAFSNLSYSQEGEDLILNRFFSNKENGFYVDVGAHHPRRFSNTYSFYKKGWRGINIDALPGSMVAFNKERPNDINLEIGISKKESELLYYMFNEPALNTFSETEALKKDGLQNYRIIEKRKVNTYPLKQVLDKHLGKNQNIDFMTIDVEGFDLEVVESNDWKRYRPSFLLVEDLNKNSLADLPSKSDLYKFLIINDYILVAKTFNTLFFKDNKK